MARRTGEVRPVQVSRSMELDHTISIDACHWKRNRDGREAVIVNIIDEASRVHVALVLKEGEPSQLGNLTAMDYIEAVRMNWFRFARAPAVIRVDSESAFKSHEFRQWCAARGIEVQMAAGEAHWQIGLVDTHIRLLKNQPSLMEEELPDASIDELVEHCVAAKVRRQTFDGYSPLQWWFGSQCAREVQEQGLGENRPSFERRLQFQTAAQTAFVRADARKTLRMAQYARSRVLRNPTVGQLVTYFRRIKGGVGGGRDRGLGGKIVLLGPATVLAVEQPTEVESQVAAVVWLAHEGSLTRAALEHWWLVHHWIPHCLKLPIQILRYLVLHGFETFEISEELSTLSLGILILNQNVWILGKIPMVENSNNMVTFSHHRQIQLLYRHLQLQNQSLHSNLLEILTILHLVSVLFDFVTVQDGFSHDQIHIKAHTVSQRTHLASDMNQGLLLGMDSQSVLMRQIVL